MTPKQKENKKYPTKGNKEYYKFSQCLALTFKPLMMAERKEKQKQYWRQTMAIVIDAPRVKNCGDCIGYLRCKGWTDEPYSCPIIGEIPDKHGDLVDRDYIKANGLSLNDAPVILEASK